MDAKFTVNRSYSYTIEMYENGRLIFRKTYASRKGRKVR